MYKEPLITGKWIGESYDGDIVSGFVVISKNRLQAEEELVQLIEKNQ